MTPIDDFAVYYPHVATSGMISVMAHLNIVLRNHLTRTTKVLVQHIPYVQKIRFINGSDFCVTTWNFTHRQPELRVYRLSADLSSVTLLLATMDGSDQFTCHEGRLMTLAENSVYVWSNDYTNKSLFRTARSCSLFDSGIISCGNKIYTLSSGFITSGGFRVTQAKVSESGKYLAIHKVLLGDSDYSLTIFERTSALFSTTCRSDNGSFVGDTFVFEGQMYDCCRRVLGEIDEWTGGKIAVSDQCVVIGRMVYRKTVQYKNDAYHVSCGLFEIPHSMPALTAHLQLYLPPELVAMCL